MKAELDIKPFLKAINEFRTASRKKTGSVLKQVGKLVVRDAMSLTPPNSTKSAFVKKGKPAWAVHKKMGEGAIINDLLGKKSDHGHQGGVFRVRKKSTFKKAEKWQEKLGKDMAGMQHSFWATKDGQGFGVPGGQQMPQGGQQAHHQALVATLGAGQGSDHLGQGQAAGRDPGELAVVVEHQDFVAGAQGGQGLPLRHDLKFSLKASQVR